MKEKKLAKEIIVATCGPAQAQVRNFIELFKISRCYFTGFFFNTGNPENGSGYGS